MFRGREMAHPERGEMILNRLAEELGELAIVEQRPQQDGRNMTMMLGPGKEPEPGDANGASAAPADRNRAPEAEKPVAASSRSSVRQARPTRPSSRPTRSSRPNQSPPAPRAARSVVRASGCRAAARRAARGPLHGDGDEHDDEDQRGRRRRRRSRPRSSRSAASRIGTAPLSPLQARKASSARLRSNGVEREQRRSAAARPAPGRATSTSPSSHVVAGIEPRSIVRPSATKTTISARLASEAEKRSICALVGDGGVRRAAGRG